MLPYVEICHIISNRFNTHSEWGFGFPVDTYVTTDIFTYILIMIYDTFDLYRPFEY